MPPLRSPQTWPLPLTTLLLSLLLLGLAVGQVADEVEDERQARLAIAEAGFAGADARLNELYGELREATGEAEFSRLRESQLEWLRHRDWYAEQIALLQGSAEEGEEAGVAEFWSARATATDMRSEFLEGWLLATARALSDLGRWEGRWVDGYGGELLLRELEDGRLVFRLFVVRGPTFHLGEIEGEARVAGRAARFETTNEGGEPTLMIFTRREPLLEVAGENTWYYHGARAYFDGSYVRVAELTEAEREELAGVRAPEGGPVAAPTGGRLAPKPSTPESMPKRPARE